MILAALLASGLASAGPAPVRALTEALDRRSAPSKVAISCAPADEVIPFLVAVAQAADGASADPARVAFLQRLASSEGLSSLGIAGDQAISLVMNQPLSGGVLSLPFSGDPTQAQGLLASLSDQVQPVQADVPTWWVPEGQGGGYAVELRDGLLSMVFSLKLDPALTPPPGPPGFDRALVSGLPDGRGCALHVLVQPSDLPAPAATLGLNPVELAGFVPFAAGQPALLRLRLPPGALPEAMERGAPPVAARSSQPPPITLSLGFSMAEALEIPGLAEKMEVRPGQLDRLGRWLNVDSGAVMGVFGDPRAMDFVAVLPLDESSGPVRARKVTRRLARLARKADISVLYREPQALGFLVKERVMHARIRDGLVVVGLDSQRVMDAAEGRGQPWGGPVSDAFAQEWALAMMVGLDAGGPVGPLPAMGVGLRSREDTLELGIQLQQPLPLQTLLAGFPALVGSNLARTMPTAADPSLGLAELRATMESIALAQQVHRSVHGAYLALPPAPRRADQADPTAVPWMRRAPWDRLGWAPEPPFTAGVFWVELDPESGAYTIFGECDLDGDGVRAQFRLRADEALERLSPADVY